MTFVDIYALEDTESISGEYCKKIKLFELEVRDFTAVGW